MEQKKLSAIQEFTAFFPPSAAEEARIEMARKLKELGVDVVAIAKATGLSVEDISSY